MRPFFRWSMRAKVLVGVIAAALAPVGILALTHWGEEIQRERVDVELLSALDEVAAPMRAGSVDRARVERLAEEHGVRIRVVDLSSGRVIVDADHERGSTPPSDLLSWLVLPDDLPTLAELDRERPPLAERREVREAGEHDSGVTCESDPRGVLLACSATRRVGDRVVHVEQGTVRGAVRALYERKRELLKLVLVLLPGALLLGFWLSRRLVRPIEALRTEALDRARAVDPAAPLTLDRADEIGDVTRALNALLGSIDARNRAAEGFVADLAHEVKNPIASIRACAEALTTGPIDDAKRERLAKNLEKSSERLDAVVTELLELARIEAGMAEDARQPTDLAELARGVVEASSAAHPELGFDVEAPARAMVAGIPHRLETALRNLIENAASYAAARVRVTIHRDGAVTNEVVLSVADDGPGIDEDVLPRVFDRFFTTRGSRRGTGLGLAMVRAIAEAHGGRVAARSRQGAGALFELALPAA